ncbi:hypothetical protein [Ruegeria sediminis]|nr:hypothetical protein [Ruegeria sediminis]
MEKIEPNQIFVHTVEPDLAVLEPLARLGVQIVEIERFGDGKHCNKLAQPLSPAEYDADILIMNDCDIAMTGSFLPAIKHEAAIAFENGGRFALGKTVDFCNPPLAIMSRLMTHFQIGAPTPLAFDTLAMEPMPKGYFNGGVYGLPVPLLKEFGSVWQEWATRLLESGKAREILGDFLWHVDQISFYFAMRELAIHAHTLDERFNFPIHVRYPAARLKSVERPHAIHFHNNLGEDGMLGLNGIRVVDIVSAKVNACLDARGLGIDKDCAKNKPFNSWRPLEKDFSMTTENAAQLHTLLKAAGISTAETVLDVRCATARHVEGLDLKYYRGFDTRPTQIGLARRRGIDALFIEALPEADDRAELVLCLDFRGFVEDIGNPEDAAKLLGDLTANRLLVLAEPPSDPIWNAEGAAQVDAASALAGTGMFQDMLELGVFAGRRAILAFSKREVTDATRLLGSGVERLYAWLDGKRTVDRWSPDAGCAAEIRILKRLPEQLHGCRICLFAGKANHSVFEAALDLRGAIRFASNQSATDGTAVNAGILESDAATTSTDADQRNIEQFDFIVVLPDVDARTINAGLIERVSSLLKPGGTVFVALPTRKRSSSVVCQDEGKSLSCGDIVNLLENHSLLATSVKHLPLPYGHPTDVVTVEAVKVGRKLAQRKKRKRTPEFLRRFEQSVRLRIRGNKSGK